jgi:NADH-quinone oxidoreductase subunit E
MAVQNTQGGASFPPELVSFINDWTVKPGSLIMILHKTQEVFGYIPREAAEKLSLMTDIPLARIYGVITFYHFFKTKKPGKYKVSVCLGTACYLKGGQDVFEAMQDYLKVKPGEVTTDGLFSVEDVRCVGCCGLAPVMTINEDTYGKMTKDQIPGIIAKYRPQA